MVPRQRPPCGEQTWRSFIHNHAREVWACDFLTQYTAFFTVIHVFVIMEIGSRRVVHVNVTGNPALACVKQQVREATAWNRSPRSRAHDNGGTYRRWGKPVAVEAEGRRRSYRCHLGVRLFRRGGHP